MMNFEKPFIVLEMANNHNGDIEHGFEIVKNFSDVCKGYSHKFEFAIKFQYRNLENFIHKDFVDQDIKYVRRFLDTQLSEEEWKSLLDFSKQNNFKLICTPFDEDSVQKVVNDNFDILKIASASMDDWPLLETIVKTNLPIIASVGGASIEKIKRLYYFMKNREKTFALNYCVSTYPTNLENLNLEYIEYMRNLFPDISIGFSTHEGNESPLTGALAYSKGARIFEKHIALNNKDKNFKANDYSATPEDLDVWLQNLVLSTKIVGTIEGRKKYLSEEDTALKSLKRGMYAKNNISKGKILTEEDIYYAIPTSSDQYVANDFSKFNILTSTTDIDSGSSIVYSNTEIIDNKLSLESIRDEVKGLLDNSNIYHVKDSVLEISHHYGINQFKKCGCTLITLINKQYCKKIIVLLPGQENPEHYHKKKEESFVMIYGNLDVKLDNKHHLLKPGDILHIPILSKHSFSTKEGAVFEEISTTHFTDDSFYTDEKINSNTDRKSFIPFS